MHSARHYHCVLLLLAIALSGCDRGPAPTTPALKELPPPEVTIATPLSREVTDMDEYTGRLAAVNTVDIHARVGGYLESIHFEEGALVSAGELLYIIDQRPYQAVLDQARANVMRAAAALDLAHSDLARAEKLFQSKTISQEVYDTRKNQQREAAAALEAAQAEVRTAEIDLDFTRIKAPISGRIGRTQVTVGNLVKGGDSESTLLTTIVSLDPIYLYLTADEQTFLRYLRASDGQFGQHIKEQAHPAYIRLADENQFTRSGYIDFVDNQVDASTGTILVRAVIPNPDHLLLPGMFAHVQIPVAKPHPALLIPDAAIKIDQTLQYVLVVNSDNIAEQRVVTTGAMAHGLRAIRAGLMESERVIIKGIQRVRPGNKVNPTIGSIEPIAETAAPVTSAAP